MASSADFDWDRAETFSHRAAAMKPSPIREFLKLLGQPGITSFAGGIPDSALFPIDDIAGAAARITSDPVRCREVLQYAASEGYEPLREWIAGYMETLGVACSVDNIVVTTGSQQGIDMLGKLFLDPGDTLLVTAPTYLGALQAFNVYEPSFAVIDPESGDVRGELRTPAMGYVIADFANPTGETIPVASRESILDTLADLGLPVIEDAAYQALRFEGESLPPLLALDLMRTGHIDRSRVIYAGTFSKTIAPGLRVGWLCAARSVVQKVVLARQASDLHGSTLDQAILHEVVTEGFQQHVERLIPVYRHRRDVMLAALEESMPSGVSWTRPAGGMFVWLTLPEGLDSRVLLRDSLEEERVIFVPGTSFFHDGSGARYLRLNYTRSDDVTIIDGIQRLGRLVARHLQRDPAADREHAADVVGAAL